MASQDFTASRGQLARLAALRDEGVLTEEEYAAKRAGIVDAITSATETGRGDRDPQGRRVNWLGITIGSMLIPFYGFYGIYAWITRFNWKRRWQSALIFWAPALVVLGALGLVAAADPGAFGGGNATEVPDSRQTLSVGDTWIAADDGWLITATDATTTDAFQGGLLGLPKVAQGVYLAVTVRLENTGAGAHALGKNRFKITDSQGREFSAAGFNESFGGGSYGNDISLGRDVIAGGTLEGVLFFDVPLTAAGLQLHVIGGGIIALGDLTEGNLTQTPSSSAGAASDKFVRCPAVLEFPWNASTEELVTCVPWAENSPSVVSWGAIAETLCERKRTEDMPANIAEDPVVATLSC